MRPICHRRVPRQAEVFQQNLGEPEFDGLGLGAGYALDQAQEGLGIGNIGETHATVVSW